MNAEQMRRMRECMGWSQRELAVRLGRHQTTISLYEQGRQPIPEQVAAAMASLCGQRHTTGDDGCEPQQAAVADNAALARLRRENTRLRAALLEQSRELARLKANPAGRGVAL